MKKHNNSHSTNVQRMIQAEKIAHALVNLQMGNEEIASKSPMPAEREFSSSQFSSGGGGSVVGRTSWEDSLASPGLDSQFGGGLLNSGGGGGGSRLSSTSASPRQNSSRPNSLRTSAVGGGAAVPDATSADSSSTNTSYDNSPSELPVMRKKGSLAKEAAEASAKAAAADQAAVFGLKNTKSFRMLKEQLGHMQVGGAVAADPAETPTGKFSGSNQGWQMVQVISPEDANRLVLNQGAVFTKHGRLGVPHHRKVWLSPDCTKVFWQVTRRGEWGECESQTME